MKKSIYLIFAAFSLVSTSCNKDFLEKLPSEQLSPEQLAAAAAKDPSLLNGSVAGLYTSMYKQGTGGTGGHDDFGQKGYDIFSDLLSCDMALGGVVYNWYSGMALLQPTRNFARNEAYIPWRYYYRIILGANTIFDALGGDDAPQTDRQLRHVVGQAKAMRAYAYFYLSQFYSREGYGTGTEKILPIYRSATQPNQPLSTSKQVYDLIIGDLTQAVEYLDDFNRSSKDQIDQSVAKGLLSYALATRGTQEDLEQAATLTDEIISDYGYPLTTEDETVARFSGPDGSGSTPLNPQSGFNNINTPSWMWGVDLTIASDVNIASFWGAVDVYTYGYPSVGDTKLMDENLYNAMRPDDIRRGQFGDVSIPEWGDLIEGLIPHKKFFHPDRIADGQQEVTADYLYMRVDEFYLLNAEVKAKLVGREGEARDRLKELLAKRLTDISYVDALSGTYLQDEIYLQTRLELWGEGKSYLAMKRNKATVAKGPNHLYLVGQSFPYNSDWLTFPIPQAEVLNNPVLYK